MSNTSRMNAREHIEQIEAGYAPKADDAIAKALTEAIKVLSDELYGNSTHFIQELLQNSDDNSFDCSDPTVTFTYRPGSLRVDCNEKGFSSANVDAICAIRRSTKAACGNSDYTGEKGIGFKSVFRAADVVWVASREYRFKFDRSQRFGILSPTWAEFPEQELCQHGHTSFYLQLSPKFNERELVTELRHFDPTQLVFLRRLRKIHIRIYAEQNAETPWEQTIHRYDSDDGSTTRLDIGNSTQQYLIQEHKLTDLPSEPKRPASTKLVLAFPVTDITAELLYQKVYAGLPIGEIEMFKFLLHGDFILTASRSDIDASVPWNRAVRDGLPETLLLAIENLAKGPLRHAWPGFLTSRKEGFFYSAMKTVMEHMRNEECLESCVEDHMARPANLKYIDKKLCDSDSQPFTLWSSTAARYLCSNYPPMAIGIIKDLGVLDLTHNDFLDDLQQMISADSADFQSRPSHWHADLCKTLLSFVGDQRLRDRLSEIPIIPLSNGAWVTASDYPKPVLEREDIALGDFPTSDMFPTVDQSATASRHRKALFMALGIGPIDTSQLCQRICKEHSSPGFDPEKWSRSQLITHAKVLFRHNWSPRDGDVDLWFATSSDRRCKGSQLYIEGDHGTGTPSERIFRLVQQAFPIIHSDYLPSLFSRAPDEEDFVMLTLQRYFFNSDPTFFDGSQWKVYLTERLQVSEVPRLVDVTPGSKDKKAFELSDVFKYIFQNAHITDVISTLDENWHFYSRWIEPDKSQQQSEKEKMQTAQLVSTIGNVFVKTSQERSPLSATFIPDLDDQIDGTILPTLDIATPVQKSLRNRLGLFGVTVENDLAFYLACLRALKDQLSPDINTIAHVYEQIESRLDDEEDAVEHAFNGDALIYIGPVLEKSSKTTERWATAGDVRIRKLNIHEEYTRSRRLFKFLLESGHLTFRQLTQEAVCIDQSWTKTKIFQTMNQINHYLEDCSTKTSAKMAKSLRFRSIFPVTRSEDEDKCLPEGLLSADNETWFIADRPHLRRSFQGKVPLLSFPPDDVAKLDDLLKAFGLQTRKLSIAVTSQKLANGALKFDTAYTTFFRKRAEFIQKLIPKSKERKSFCLQIESVRVSVAAEVYETYSLKRTGSEIKARPCRSEILCSATGYQLQIFVAAQYRSPWQCPTAAIVNMISAHFGINDPLHLSLLWTLFIERDMDQVNQAFERQGVHVFTSSRKALLTFFYSRSGSSRFRPGNSEAGSKTDTHAWIRSRDLIDVPVPSSDDSSDDSDSYQRSESYGVQYRRKSRTSRTGKRWQLDKHIRRLPVLFPSEDVGDKECKDNRIDTHLDQEFLGQRLTSSLFERELGNAYVPIRHWTSSLRIRSGLRSLGSSEDGKSPFTLTGSSVTAKMTEYLIRHGIKRALPWRGLSNLRYHCEVAATAGGIEEEFRWTSKKIDRARVARLREHPNRDVFDVMVMIRIGHIYSKPVARLLLDPWNLLCRGHMEIGLGSAFHAIVLRQYKDNPKSSRDDTGSKERCLEWDGSARISKSLFQMPSPQFPPWPSIPPQSTSGAPSLPSTLPAQNTYSQSNSQQPPSTVPAPHVHPTPFIQYLPSFNPVLIYGATAYGISLPPAPPPAFQGYWAPWTVPRPSLNNLNYGTQPQSKPSTAVSDSAREDLPVSNVIDIMDHLSVVPYAYRKLSDGQIRLFTLFPGKDRDGVKGMIHCVPFEGTTPFHAVSYVWGEERQPTREVLTPEGFLKVAETLYMNLRRLRRDKEPVVLWIDAICINQKNPGEKSKQVQLLPRVYQRAECTLALLGTKNSDNEAVQMLLQVEAFRELGRNSKDWPKGLERCPTSWGESGIPPLDDQVWARVADLFNDTWFRRVWIVQEAVASPIVKIVCGKQIGLWDNISGAMRHLDREHGQMLPPPVMDAWKPFEALDVLRKWEGRQTRWSVLLLLEYFRHVKSTLARDRLFALLGISCDGDLKGFEPDYSAPFEKVVLSFARALVDTGSGMKLLYRAGIGSKPERFPSWVPDWTVPKPGGLYAARDRGLLFHAGGKAKGQIKYHEKGPEDELLVEGYEIGRIRDVSKWTNTPGDWKPYFDEIDRMVDSLGPDHFADRYRFKRDVPIAGAKHPPIATSQPLDIEEAYKAFQKVLKKSKWTNKYKRKGGQDCSTSSVDPSTIGSQPNDELGLREKSEAYESLLSGTLEGWRFVVTDGNRCGIAPPGVAIGNRVIILPGGEVPFILQDSEDREKAHRLVGECYVADCMFGEVFKSGNPVRSTFRIH